MSRDFAQVLTSTGRDFQQPFCLYVFQHVDKMGSFEFCDWQEPDFREDMIVHAGKQAGRVVP